MQQKIAKLALAFLLMPRVLMALTQYDIEAAYLLNFARFVDWPSEALRSDHINVCVIGQDPYGDRLERIFNNQQVKGKKPSLKRYTEAESATDCQIAFIGATDPAKALSIIKKLRGEPVLTVSDVAGFAEGGGIVQFRLNDGRVGFRINLKEARQSGLEISSKLLKIAEVLP